MTSEEVIIAMTLLLILVGLVREFFDWLDGENKDEGIDRETGF